HADGGRDSNPALFRRPGCAARRDRIEKLDHARRGAGDPLLPPARLAPGRHPRTHSAAERLPTWHEPDTGRTGPAGAAGNLARIALWKDFAPAAGGGELGQVLRVGSRNDRLGRSRSKGKNLRGNEDINVERF